MRCRRWRLRHGAATIAAMMAFVSSGCQRPAAGQPELQVAFGLNGVQRIVYKGVVLEDLEHDPADAFKIVHMKMADLSGKVVSTGQYGWGENHDSRQWDPGTRTWTYRFTWGSVRVQFVQDGNTLAMRVTEENAAGSGMMLDGAVIQPFVLHLPRLPQGFKAGEGLVASNTSAPSVTVADYGKGEIVAIAPEVGKPVYSGFLPVGKGLAYVPVVSGTVPDGAAASVPHADRPVAPGQTETFTVALRFAASGTAATQVAADVYRNWTARWPAQLHWPDRRAIGTVYLASSPQGDASRAAGYANNPRRYFNDSKSEDFDVTYDAGLSRFQVRVLRQAESNVENLRKLQAQGAITWDIEGEQFPQDTSYVCSPDQIATVAPEMEKPVGDWSQTYRGMKLADAYFKIMRDAGFRIGVCVRPQHFTLRADGTATQVTLPDTAVAAELIRKMRYAHDRWGATLFYMDSTVSASGAVLDAAIFREVAAALPDSLLIPEENSLKHYAYTAPFQSFLFHRDTGTDAAVRSLYPDAFSVNLINDVSPSELDAAHGALVDAVRHGDILMGHVSYWHPNNDVILQIYQDAGR